MMTHFTEDAQAWRDLADQLTPGQVAELATQQVSGTPTADDQDQQRLLNIAREFAAKNAANAIYANVPHPAGALTVGEWEVGYGDLPVRMFEGRKWAIDHMVVGIDGNQIADGATEYQVRIVSRGTFHDGEMTTDQARRIAVALVEAADELDLLR